MRGKDKGGKAKNKALSAIPKPLRRTHPAHEQHRISCVVYDSKDKRLVHDEGYRRLCQSDDCYLSCSADNRRGARGGRSRLVHTDISLMDHLLDAQVLESVDSRKIRHTRIKGIRHSQLLKGRAQLVFG